MANLIYITLPIVLRQWNGCYQFWVLNFHYKNCHHYKTTIVVHLLTIPTIYIKQETSPSKKLEAMQYLSRDLNPHFLLSLKKFRKRVRERRVNENNRADGSKSRRIPAKNHTKN